MEEVRKVRYTVTVAPPGAAPIRLLIPFPPTSSISALAAEVKRRLARTDPNAPDLILHLGDVNGPILDEEDLLEDVIVDAEGESITATPRSSLPSTGPAPPANHAPVQQVPPTSTAQEVKVRVITPALARVHKDVRTIPLLSCATITRKSTLREVKFQISNHLQIPILDVVQPSQECNCSFARQIDERALRSGANPSDEVLLTPFQRFVVVYGQNRVQILETEAKDKISLVEAVRRELGENVRSKEINFVGGHTLPNTSEMYSKLPVLSVCSRARHERSNADSGFADRSDLDLHTSETPIETSSLNMGLTIDELGLTDYAINGVLNIYVVQRKLSAEMVDTESGKDAIFVNGNAWIHPVPQSMRGMAMLLSSLRVFTDRIGAKKMEHPSQDAVLHIFNLLTRFPPAVRTVHILMNGKSPRACERAALAQSLYEVLKDVVPALIIKSDLTRLSEGARLLFGLILEKAKHLKLKEDVQMPYISSLKVLDLRNTFTMEPIANAIQTPFGLVEEGYYEAFKEGGILYWKTGEQPLAALPLDERTRRVSLLCGGLISQITVFDMNILNSIAGYGKRGDIDTLIPRRELSDLNHLSALCSRNDFSVLAPSALTSAEAPALTLDREGLLAVYVGRAPCSQPGKDISIFRPTKGGEETIDVAVITQLLVPILEKREAEGTVIFDAFGDGFQRKFRVPDEIIMVCVDCSSSMSEDTDFLEIRDSDSEIEGDEEDSDDSDIDMSDQAPQANTAADGSSYFCATLDEMKKSISEHESFTDMLYIVHDTLASKRRDVACKVLEILSGLASQELSKNLQRLEDLKQRVTLAFYRAQAAVCESEITKLKTFTAGLNIHRQALADFLIYRSSNMEVFDDQWTWTVGNAIPKMPKISSDNSPNPLLDEQFLVPDEFLCPISREVMDDPVLASDGFTFERNAIERWFQIRKSSPLTGLVLDNTDLRANGQLANQVKDWINGSDLIKSAPIQDSTASSSRTRSSSGSQHMITVRFFSRLGSFNRQVPRTLPVNTLYRLAFRGMKGRHSKFELHFKNLLLDPSESTLASANIRDNSVIHIDVPEARSADAIPPQAGAANLEELCLVKAYTQSSQMAFSYWIPRRTTNTFASVIFKYWRHRFKNDSWQYIFDLVPWTGMNDQGDGHLSGHFHDHWEKLSGFLNHRDCTGQLKNEKLCESGSSELEDDIYNDVDMEQGPSPLVLKIWLGGKPASKNKSGKNLSRLDVLKSMFDAFVNRLLAYNYHTHMGLITFQSSATVSQNITHAIENFRHKVNGMNARGDTALWDALALANDQLSEYAKKFPNAKKRIICISDGDDTKSKQRSSDVSWSLFQNKVVVDSFCLGSEDNVDLRTVSYLSGGYKFTPQSLEQSMLLCEMEPILNQLERPPVTYPREALSHGYDPHLRFVFAKDKATPEVVTADIFPQRKQHPNINDHFVRLSTVAGNGVGGASQGSELVNAHSNSNLRTSRILVEIRSIVANPHPHYDVYLSESNMSFWKVVIQGPPESAYSTGTFVLYVDMEEDYPAFPPKCRFTTPIYHPNINRHGKVCHSILDRNWTSDTSNLQLINTIYSLLLVPEFSDPVNSVVTLNYHWDEVAFREEVKAHIRRHATKDRAAWKMELLAE